MIDFHTIEMGQGPTLLFLHGFMGSGEDWRPVFEHLSDHFHCVAVDLPGHGKTQCDEPALYRMENVTHELVKWLTQNKVLCHAVIGYSMGGRLALYCALCFPHCFPQAVVESGTAGLREHEETKARRELDLVRSSAIEADFLNFLSSWYCQPLFTSLWKHSLVFKEMQQRRQRNDPLGLARSLREMGTGVQPNLWQHLDSHPNPLLLLTGELDQKFTRINREMKGRCQSARHEIIPGVGHNIHLEDPEAIANQIQQFLAP